MAVGRAAIASHLSGTYGALLADFGLAAEDAPSALKEPIDTALLALGVDYDDLSTGTVDALKGFCLARYYLLMKMQGSTAAKNVNVSMGDPNTSKSNRDRATNLSEALAAVKAEMQALGLGTSGSWFASSLTLDYLEPDEEVA